MGVSIGFGVGPVRVSKRIGGKRKGHRACSSAVDALETSRKRREKILAMTDSQFTNHVRLQWVAVGVFAVWMLASAWPLALLAVPLGLLVAHYHREQRRSRAAAGRAGLPAVDPRQEAAFARQYGLPVGVWEDAVPTESFRVPRPDGSTYTGRLQ